MRFTGKSKSGVDPAIEVYNFTIGKAELLILRDVLNYLHVKVPRSFFTQPFTSRLDSMKNEIGKTLLADGVGKSYKRPIGWNPDEPKEVF